VWYHWRCLHLLKCLSKFQKYHWDAVSEISCQFITFLVHALEQMHLQLPTCSTTSTITLMAHIFCFEPEFWRTSFFLPLSKIYYRH
jgi:hypothetical protein